MIRVSELKNEELSFADKVGDDFARLGSEIFLPNQSRCFIGKYYALHFEGEEVGELGFDGFDFG